MFNDLIQHLKIKELKQELVLAANAKKVNASFRSEQNSRQDQQIRELSQKLTLLELNQDFIFETLITQGLLSKENFVDTLKQNIASAEQQAQANASAFQQGKVQKQVADEPTSSPFNFD